MKVVKKKYLFIVFIFTLVFVYFAGLSLTSTLAWEIELNNAILELNSIDTKPKSVTDWHNSHAEYLAKKVDYLDDDISFRKVLMYFFNIMAIITSLICCVLLYIDTNRTTNSKTKKATL